MKLENSDRISQSLRLLSQALSPYVEQKMREVHGNTWLYQVKLCISNKNNSNRSDEEILQDVNEALARVAQDLNLGKWMKLGRGEQLTGGRTNPSLLSNTLEAVIGAYYKDYGIDAVWEWLKPMLEQLETIKIEPNSSQILPDAKNRFQEWAIKQHRQNPEYILIEESGSDHDRVFGVEVRVNGCVYGYGKAT